MIYLDSSVALAHLLVEDRAPPETIWQAPLISSRLLEYEVWNRVHARGLGRSHGQEARALIGRLALIELDPPVLARAVEPFPVPVRTLDALHLASIEFLRSRRQGHSRTWPDGLNGVIANQDPRIVYLCCRGECTASVKEKGRHGSNNHRNGNAPKRKNKTGAPIGTPVMKRSARIYLAAAAMSMLVSLRFSPSTLPFTVT